MKNVVWPNSISVLLRFPRLRNESAWMWKSDFEKPTTVAVLHPAQLISFEEKQVKIWARELWTGWDVDQKKMWKKKMWKKEMRLRINTVNWFGGGVSEPLPEGSGVDCGGIQTGKVIPKSANILQLGKKRFVLLW